MREEHTDHETIDAQIARRIEDLDLRAELLAEGQTIAYVDAAGRIVEETPEGQITVLHDTGTWG